MTSRAFVSIVVSGCLVLGAGGWLLSLPRPAAPMIAADVLPVEVVPVAPVSSAPVPSAPGSSGPGASATPTATATRPATPAPTATPSTSVAPGATSKGTTQRTIPRVQAAWLTRVAARTGIPPRALQSYATAALATATSNPGCRLGWNTLAAIGSVESAHGTLGGATVAANGEVTPRILGPVLDGTTGFAAVPDSDHGALDDDPTWDRAVGPLQFLPSTWALDGVDGNGDGTVDIDNLDDAALTAAHYLCAAAGDLSIGVDWTAAVQAYNHDPVYVSTVRAQANAYAAESAA